MTPLSTDAAVSSSLSLLNGISFVGSLARHSAMSAAVAVSPTPFGPELFGRVSFLWSAGLYNRKFGRAAISRSF